MYSLPGLPLNVPMYQDIDLALNVQKMGSIRVVMISISGQEIWLKNKSKCMHEVCTLGLAHWGEFVLKYGNLIVEKPCTSLTQHRMSGPSYHK